MTIKKQGETSYKETAFGIIPRSKLIPLEIAGIKRAWDFVLQKHQKGKIAITPNFIKKAHQVGFGWIFPKTAGKFRQIEVTVSNHTPPKFYLVPQLILNFCRDLETRLKHLPTIEESNFLDKLTELLAWAQHRFLWIHPFQDYNGRLGRLLTNIILLNLNLPPIELQVETKSGRQKYIKALQMADDGNLEKFKKLIEAAAQEASKSLSKS